MTCESKRGDKREGAGRKSTGLGREVYYVTPEEGIKLRELLDELRKSAQIDSPPPTTTIIFNALNVLIENEDIISMYVEGYNVLEIKEKLMLPNLESITKLLKENGYTIPRSAIRYLTKKQKDRIVEMFINEYSWRKIGMESGLSRSTINKLLSDKGLL